MNDNAPHKPRNIHSVWPIVVLLMFFSVAIGLWGKSPFLAVVVGLIGIIIYWLWAKVRTKMMTIDLALRELFKDL